MPARSHTRPGGASRAKSPLSKVDSSGNGCRSITSKCESGRRDMMPQETYQIRPAWPDAMVYQQNDGNVLTLDSPSMAEPPHVIIPGARSWTERMPAWTHERRQIILDRLREAGCIVHEQDDHQTAIVSPH